MIERDEAPNDPPFEDEMFFKWQPSSESADTDSEDESPQMRASAGTTSENVCMGGVMPVKKVTKTAKKPAAAAGRTVTKKAAKKK
jgi:hypothetical protein